MNQLKYIYDSFIRHNVDGKLDVRVTLSRKGIKVNIMSAFKSNKPTGFDLTQAIIDSCQIGVKGCDKMIAWELHSENIKNHFQKQKDWLNDVITELSKQPYN